MQPTKPAGNIAEEALVTDTLKHKIQGTLYDEVTKQPIAALIVLKHKGISTISNSRGNFDLFISEKDIRDNMILKVNAVGFKEAEVSIYRKNLTNITLYIKMQPAEREFVGEIRCTASEKK
jgi:hypothetical protein